MTGPRSVAWDRVAGNRGAQTAGVDAVTRFYVENSIGLNSFLSLWVDRAAGVGLGAHGRGAGDQS
jgi:retron-type reverse transcriptase